MGIVLGIIAIAVLLVLIVASLKVRLGERGAERQEADVRAQTGQAQHEESLRLRAEVRAAPAEQTDTIAPDTDE
jgi:predicted Holliday junction resolvase-like endonuclease